jgi:DNA replication ATP-dependent helicase Dna2
LKQYEGLRVLTIDKAQGIDSDIVIISFTKWTNDKGQLLSDIKRLNVSITRAKKKLIFIGCEQYLKEYEELQKIFEILNEKEWV